MELSGGSDVGWGEKVRGPENGAPGDSEGLNVMPGLDCASCLGADRLAARITMITNSPVARKIFTIPALSVGGAAVDAPADVDWFALEFDPLLPDAEALDWLAAWV